MAYSGLQVLGTIEAVTKGPGGEDHSDGPTAAFYFNSSFCSGAGEACGLTIGCCQPYRCTSAINGTCV